VNGKSLGGARRTQDPLTIDSLPFELRIGAFLALAALVAAIDLAFRRRAATRWREYLFLLAAASIGAVYGVINDRITSSISPEYFTLGKQIPSGSGFPAQVVRLGASAGFFGGAIAACALLYANNPHPRYNQLSYPRLARLALFPAALAFIGSILGAAIGYPGILGARAARLFPQLDSETAESFCRVWLIHVGLYLGLLLGTVVAFRGVRRARRLSSEQVMPGAA